MRYVFFIKSVKILRFQEILGKASLREKGPVDDKYFNRYNTQCKYVLVITQGHGK